MFIHVLSCSSDYNISVRLQILRKFDCFKKPLLHTFEVTRNVIEQFITKETFFLQDFEVQLNRLGS